MLNLPIKILKTIQLQTAQASVTFSAINTLVARWDAAKHVTSRHLVVIANTANDGPAFRWVLYTINGDAGLNYNHQALYGHAVAKIAVRQEALPILYMGFIPGTTFANAFGGGAIIFPHAFNVANHKVALSLGGAAEDYVSTIVGRWAAVAAITSLTISTSGGSFVAGSSLHLGVVDERYLVSEVNLAAPATAIFNNIPQGEGDLVVVGYARSDRAAVEDEVLHVINGDVIAANYPGQELTGRAAVVAAGSPINQECGMISGANATANAFGALVAIYSQYSKAKQLHYRSESGYHESTGPTGEARIMSGRRANIEPINKIIFRPNAGVNFLAGSLFSLYRVPKRIIQRQELAVAQATVTFANIPQNFEALLLHVYAKTDRAAASDPVLFTINADAVAANYDTQKLDGTGAVVTAAQSLADRNWLLVSGSAGGSPAAQFDGGALLFPGYAKTDRHKHGAAFYGVGESTVFILSARWENLAAITSIVLAPVNGPNFLAGSVFELEGILRKEGLPPVEGGQWGI